jgi:hypothetical protein
MLCCAVLRMPITTSKHASNMHSKTTHIRKTAITCTNFAGCKEHPAAAKKFPKSQVPSAAAYHAATRVQLHSTPCISQVQTQQCT